MGTPKQLLHIDGKPILQHVVDAAAASCLDEIIVVLGHRAAEIENAIHPPGMGKVRFVTNERFDEGQSTSLQAGLRAASPQSEAAVVLLGDQPGVSEALIDRIVGAFEATGAKVVRPVWLQPMADVDGVDAASPRRIVRRVPGHPVVLTRSTWGELEALRGDEGARSLIAAHPEWLLEVEIEGELPRDVDTPADYDALRGKQRGD